MFRITGLQWRKHAAISIWVRCQKKRDCYPIRLGIDVLHIPEHHGEAVLQTTNRGRGTRTDFLHIVLHLPRNMQTALQGADGAGDTVSRGQVGLVFKHGREHPHERKVQGDALLQKTFCVYFLAKEMKQNADEPPQCYVK